MNELKITPRLLLGPGPSNVHNRVLTAMSTPVIGHLDPQFLKLMDEIQENLRKIFQTNNQHTFPVSGTGSAAMEMSLCNLIEPGDSVLICINGFFGERLFEMAMRYGAEVHRLEVPWGSVFDLDDIRVAISRYEPKVVALVHAETSTGALQVIDGIGELVHHYGGLLVVDCVTSLGGIPVNTDEWDADIVYAGSQKCLSVPPGLGPITFGFRVSETLESRKSKVVSWYLDLTALTKYWGKDRTYHHTAPISMVYALYEGLRLILDEGLEECWSRHKSNAELLWSGLEGIGLRLVISSENRLPTLTTVWIPEDIDDLAVRRKLIEKYNIEIAGGLGEFSGKIWRIGLMGHSSRKENVQLLIEALKDVLKK